MQDQRSNDVAASGGFSLLMFLAGAALGAGVALLLAPAPGHETRRKLLEGAKKVGQNVGDKVNSAKDELSRRSEDVRSAVSAGRDAYTRARSQTGEPAPTSTAM
jgi:gas vesicle protein